jgi:hypothetical protein
MVTILRLVGTIHFLIFHQIMEKYQILIQEILQLLHHQDSFLTKIKNINQIIINEKEIY